LESWSKDRYLGGMMSIELAKLFHTTYERLAPNFGYETRADTKEFDANSPNGKLMVAVCVEIEAAIREDERKCSEPVAWKCTVDGVHWAFSEKKKCRYCLPVYESPVAWMREDSCMVIPDKAKQLLLKAKKKEAELYKIPLYLSPQPDREKELLAEIERLNNEIRTQCDNCSLIDGG